MPYFQVTSAVRVCYGQLRGHCGSGAGPVGGLLAAVRNEAAAGAGGLDRPGPGKALPCYQVYRYTNMTPVYDNELLQFPDGGVSHTGTALQLGGGGPGCVLGGLERPTTAPPLLHLAPPPSVGQTRANTHQSGKTCKQTLHIPWEIAIVLGWNAQGKQKLVFLPEVTEAHLK